MMEFLLYNSILAWGFVYIGCGTVDTGLGQLIEKATRLLCFDFSIVQDSTQ